MKRFFVVTLVMASFFSLAVFAEAGLLKGGKTPPTGKSIYKKRGTTALATKPAAATTRPTTATMNKTDSMNKEVPARRY